jgi:hypothetical protein
MHPSKHVAMQHRTLSGYAHLHCRNECCASVIRSYQQRRKLEHRVLVLAAKHAEAVAELEAFDTETPAAPSADPLVREVDEEDLGADLVKRFAHRVFSKISAVRSFPAKPSFPAPQSAPTPWPLTIGLQGRWRYGDVADIGFLATRKAPAELPCPRCGRKGLVGTAHRQHPLVARTLEAASDGRWAHRVPRSRPGPPRAPATSSKAWPST